MVPIFDVILLLVIVIFATWGFFLGFIEAVGSLLGLVLAAFLAEKYYLPVSHWFSSSPSTAFKVLAFLLIFVLVSKLVGLIFYFLGKIFKIISFLPFLKTANRLLGGILGALEGVFICGAFLYIIKFLPTNGWLKNSLHHSVLTPFLLKIFHPLLGISFWLGHLAVIYL